MDLRPKLRDTLCLWSVLLFTAVSNRLSDGRLRHVGDWTFIASDPTEPVTERDLGEATAALFMLPGFFAAFVFMIATWLLSVGATATASLIALPAYLYLAGYSALDKDDLIVEAEGLGEPSAEKQYLQGELDEDELEDRLETELEVDA